MLLAGIGDALTKAFEAEQCLAAGGRNMFGMQSSLAGVALARECYRVLRAEAVSGLAEAGQVGEPSAGFELDDGLPLVGANRGRVWKWWGGTHTM